MKKLLMVMVQSLILTVFFTMLSQGNAQRLSTSNCRDKFFDAKKCQNPVEASREPLD